MIAGARVEVAPYKRGPMDFVLWKPSRPDEPGGRALGAAAAGLAYRMLGHELRYLGETFDIHGGGIDSSFRIMKTKLRRPAPPSAIK